jgi:hypothetical protein
MLSAVSTDRRCRRADVTESLGGGKGCAATGATATGATAREAASRKERDARNDTATGVGW